MKNCRNCNKEDICGGNFRGVFPCPDFVAKKVKIKRSKIKVNRCNVCRKETKAKAALCSACRKPYEEMKAKFPHLAPDELSRLTKISIIEKKRRVIERRNIQREYNGIAMQRM